MFKNIFFLVILIVFTLIAVVIINIQFSSLDSLMLDLISYKPVYLFAYGQLILTAYLIYILFNGIYKKDISKNYGFAYVVFLVIGVFFYFIVYTHIPDYSQVPESDFEIHLQNIEVADDENGLLQIDYLHQKIIPITISASYNFPDVPRLHTCMTIKEECEDIVDAEKSLSLYKVFLDDNINEIEDIHGEIQKINSLSYFKLNPKSIEFPRYQGVTAFARIVFFQSMQYIENGEQEKALLLLQDYLQLSENIILGDTSIVGMMTAISMQKNALHNMIYLLKEYDINSNTHLRNIFNSTDYTPYNSHEISANAIHMEYQLNIHGLYGEITDSMFFNTDEYASILRQQWMSIMNTGKPFYNNKIPSILTREYTYYVLSNRALIDIQWPIEDIQELNDLREEVKLLLASME